MATTIIEIFVSKKYRYTKSNMYNTFIKEIFKITGEEILNYVEFSINYREKYCTLTDIIINYENNSGIQACREYKLVLKPQPKIDPPLVNFFIFNKINI